MLDHINNLLEMAEFFDRAGDPSLAARCRDTASKMLDHLLYFHHQRTGGNHDAK